MESSGNSFTGSYSYTLDAKGRVNIPAKMRKALNPANDRTFVATKGQDRCIMLYPLDVWQTVELKLLALNKGKAIVRQYIRNVVRPAEAVQYDSQGRIPLPAHLVDHAGINKQVEIVGMIDRIEIWNPETLESYDNDWQSRSQELEAVADGVNL